MIPQDLHALFWDVDLETFDPIQYPEYTIFRVSELGDRPAITWLRKAFSQDQIKEVIRNEQRLSPRSANFWALIYGIPLEEIAGESGTAAVDFQSAGSKGGFDAQNVERALISRSTSAISL